MNVSIESLQELVISGDRENLCSRICTLDDKQRNAISTEAIAIATTINQGWSVGVIKLEKLGDPVQAWQLELLEALKSREYVDWRVPRWTANLLAASVCERKHLEKSWNFGLSWLREDLRDMPERVLQILVARKPKWLEEWLEKEWKDERPIPNSHVERGLIRAGLASPRSDSGFYNRLAHDTMDRYRSDAQKTDEIKQRYKSVRAIIENDPGVLQEEIWGIFEVDSALLRYAHEAWGKALVELSSEGKLERDELLRRSLHGMVLSLSASSLQGMGKLHQALEPTNEEKRKFFAEYLALFRSNQATIVGLGLSVCEELLKAKQMDGKAFLEGLPDVFRVAKKAQPIKALLIATKLLKSDSSLAEQASLAAVEGLQHADVDVQSACLKFLGSIKSQLGEQFYARLSDLKDFVAASLKESLETLGSQTNGETANDKTSNAQTAITSKAKGAKVAKSAKQPQGNAQEAKSGDAIAEVIKHAEAFSATLRYASGLAAAIQQSESGQEVTINAISKRLIPRRNPDVAIHPVQSVDELIELVAKTIERIDDVIDLERILDGVCRFYGEEPENFETKTAALKKRMQKLAEPGTGKFLDRAKDIGFTQLLQTWLKIPVDPSPDRIHWYSMRGWFLRERISQLNSAVVQGRNDRRQQESAPLPMLALPTHQGGWIDPVVLVNRINENYVKHRELFDNYDLAQALLRLMPEGRSDALKLLRKKDERYYNGGDTLRYALGDDCQFDNSGGWGTEALQVAAVRARMVIDPHYQPSLPIARVEYHENHRLSVSGALTEDPTIPFWLAELAMSIEPFCGRVVAPDEQYWWLDTWQAFTNPFDSDPSCMAGHLVNLSDRESSWTYAACRLFVLAVNDDRQETRSYAADCFVEAVSSSLIPPETLGEAIAANLASIKLNRLCKVLADCCAQSQLHQAVVARSIEQVLLKLESLPSDIHLLLAVLMEVKAGLGERVPANVAERLKQLTGTSKSAKLAKQILGVSTTQGWPDKYNLLVLQSLVDRVGRWQALGA